MTIANTIGLVIGGAIGIGGMLFFPHLLPFAIACTGVVIAIPIVAAVNLFVGYSRWKREGRPVDPLMEGLYYDQEE